MNKLGKFILETGQLPDTPLFGTDGIRGKAGDILNASFTLQLGYCAGRILRQAADHTRTNYSWTRFP